MSYILDALKKSERQRSLGRVPTLDTAHYAETRPRRRWWPWAIVAVVLVNGAVLALLLRPSPSSPPASAAGPQPKTAPSVQNPVQAQVPVPPAPKTPAASSAATAAAPRAAEPKHVGTPVQQTSVAAAQAPTAPPQKATPRTLNELAPAAPPSSSPAHKPPASIANPPAATAPARPPTPVHREPARPETRVAAGAPNRTGAPEDTEAAANADAEAGNEATGQAQAPAEATAEATYPVPLLRQLPFEFQQSVPSVRIDALVYSDEQQGRMVFIDRHKYREGQEVAGQLLLEKIERGGIVLSYKGQRFLLQP
jgi:general secretion pathway protein B